MSKNKQRGFSLVELMVTMAIVGILASIAVPGYRSYVLKGDRSNAIAALQQLNTEQQRYRLQYNRYAASLTDLGYTLSGGSAEIKNSNGDVVYDMTMSADVVNNSSGQRFEAQLDATGPQAEDRCTQFTLDNKGTKGATATGISDPAEAVAYCW